MRGEATLYLILNLFFSLSIYASALEHGAVRSGDTDPDEENEDPVLTITEGTQTTEIQRPAEPAIPLPPSLQKKWVTQVFVEAANRFDMDANVSVECKRDFELYKKNLQNQTVWAVRSKYIDLCEIFRSDGKLIF